MLVRAFGKRNCIPDGSFDINGSGKFNDITDEILRKYKSLSIGAMWYTGVISHATKTSFRGIPDCNKAIIKGEAGSPYAIRNYFDVDPALAVNQDNRMAEFESLVSRTHKAGMKVIIDFVPNHVYREYKSYFKSENFYILDEPLHMPPSIADRYSENPAKATGNTFSAYLTENDWYDTIKLNYENHDTWTKMLDILLFWVSKGVDGFRCDMVELVPADFFKWAFSKVKDLYPNVFFIAEVYSKENFRRYMDAGFDYLYDKSCFYDTLKAIVQGYAPASDLTCQWQFLGDMQPKMLNFLENHDEVRVASDFYAGSGKSAYAPLAVSLLFNTAPFMIYMGQEFGERGMDSEGFSGIDGKTSIFDYCIVPSVKRWLENRLTSDEKIVYKEYQKILKIATADSIFSEGKTYDLMYANPSSEHFDSGRQFVFMRGFGTSAMVVVVNFSNAPVSVRINIPEEAFRYFGISRESTEVSVKVDPKDYIRLDVSG